MPKLIIESGEGTGREYEIGQSAVLGRLGTNEVQILDPQASRTHTKVVKEQDGYHAVDLGSRNGTVVNGIKAQNVLLKSGDRIAIGKLVLRFEDDKPPAAVALTAAPVPMQYRVEKTAAPAAHPKPPGSQKTTAVMLPQKEKLATTQSDAVSDRRQKTIRSARGEEVVALHGWKKWIALLLGLVLFVGLFFAAKWVGEKAFSGLGETEKQTEKK